MVFQWRSRSQRATDVRSVTWTSRRGRTGGEHTWLGPGRARHTPASGTWLQVGPITRTITRQTGLTCPCQWQARKSPSRWRTSLARCADRATRPPARPKEHQGPNAEHSIEHTKAFPIWALRHQFHNRILGFLFGGRRVFIIYIRQVAGGASLKHLNEYFTSHLNSAISQSV